MDEDLATLKVYANPYAHLDHKGRAAGACSREVAPNDVREGDRRYVGAAFDLEKCQVKPRAAGDNRGPQTDTVFKFDNAPQTVLDTPHYRARIRDGALVIADQDTAEQIGVQFADPGRTLTDARTRAIAAFKAHAGKRKCAVESEPPFLPAGYSPPAAPKPAPAPAPEPSPSPPPPAAAKGGN